MVNAKLFILYYNLTYGLYKCNLKAKNEAHLS